MSIYPMSHIVSTTFIVFIICKLIIRRLNYEMYTSVYTMLSQQMFSLSCDFVKLRWKNVV